jgi:hypothetical protein
MRTPVGMRFAPSRVIQALAAWTLVFVLAGCASLPVSRHNPVRHSAIPCDGLLAEASVLASDFADTSAARVAAAHAAHATKMAQYHACLAENLLQPS